MATKSTLMTVVLASLCVAFAVFSSVTFNNMRRLELEFNEKKARLVKEGLDLKDQVESLQAAIAKKTDALAVFEKENDTLSKQADQVKQEHGKELQALRSEIELLSRKQATLKKRISVLENAPLSAQLENAIAREENENVRRFLGNALTTIQLIRDGKNVDLEPIVVTKRPETVQQAAPQSSDNRMFLEEAPQEPPQEEARPSVAPSREEESSGSVLSVDQKSSLAIVSLGRRDGIREGARLAILNNDLQVIAEGEVISVRYRIAALFVDSFTGTNVVSNIREGLRVRPAK